MYFHADARTARGRLARTSRGIFTSAPLILAVLACANWPAAAEQVDLAKARAQFLSSCGVCHTAEKGNVDRQGPNLHGVVGRSAAARPDFEFSEALKTSGFVWDEPTLDRWIEDAAAMRPGTTMAYRQRDADRRKLVIAYLKTLTEPK